MSLPEPSFSPTSHHHQSTTLAHTSRPFAHPSSSDCRPLFIQRRLSTVPHIVACRTNFGWLAGWLAGRLGEPGCLQEPAVTRRDSPKTRQRLASQSSFDRPHHARSAACVELVVQRSHQREFFFFFFWWHLASPVASRRPASPVPLLQLTLFSPLRNITMSIAPTTTWPRLWQPRRPSLREPMCIVGPDTRADLQTFTCGRKEHRKAAYTFFSTAFPNGCSALLLHLSGTIPVNFRGNTYRFPVSIWIPHAYPREPPIVYVTPTETMMVRPGQHVDPQGLVYHPYLVGWAQSCAVSRHVTSPKCNLKELGEGGEEPRKEKLMQMTEFKLARLHDYTV